MSLASQSLEVAPATGASSGELEESAKRPGRQTSDQINGQINERTSGRLSMEILHKSDQVLLRLSKLLAYAGAAALFVILVLICANIVLRPFGGTIRGTAEMGGYLCALALGLCMPLSQLAGSHISGGLWNRHLPKSLRLVMEALVSAACCAVLLLAAREIGGVGAYALEAEEYIDGFEISYFSMAAALAVGLLLQGVIFAQSLLKLVILRKEAA